MTDSKPRTRQPRRQTPLLEVLSGHFTESP